MAATPTEDQVPELAADHEPAPSPPPPAGALVAVCGLCGGAGASTLAYLTAGAAGNAGEPVLVCDTGGPGGGLAAYAGVEAPRSLPRLANAIAARESLADGLFADGGRGLRVLASRPHLDADADEGGLARLLRDARQAHALTVADCGTLRAEADRQVLAAASHVLWVLPATAGGVHRATRTLGLFDPVTTRREVIVARADGGGRRASMEQLAELAARRDAPLALMPHVPDLNERPHEEALDAAALTLDAIRTVIRT